MSQGEDRLNHGMIVDVGDSVRPSGVVTFLFTDIEGSTRRWETDPDGMREALADHDDVLRSAIEAQGGWMFKHTGDGVCTAFESPGNAVDAAVAAQQALELPVRMGIATGEAELRGDDYFGQPLNRAARVMDAGHGGQILVASVAAAMVSEVNLVDLGSYQLRDLAEPETLWQVTADGLRAEFPPVRSLSHYRSNLSPQTSMLFGRERELGVIADALGDVRIVTLTGVGGVGKTRLAIHAAAAALPEFRDGVWLCELAPVNDLDGIADVAATTLGIQQQPDHDLVDSIAESLRRTETLLVLDNCEHLLDDSAVFAERIVRRCESVAILATSREGLALDGERIIAVPSLAVASEDETEPAAVQLFTDRASSLVDGFALTAENRNSVGVICARLDGIPLAIELAAARAPAMTPHEIEAHLDERFKLLTGGRRRSRERHQTLRQAIDWSYELLDEATQEAMRRLAVWGGSFDLAAAEAVLANRQDDRAAVLDLVSDLVEKSLLVAEPVGIQTRYRFLETIRQYSDERLEESGAVDATTGLAAAHLAEWADEAGEMLLGQAEAEWSLRLDYEIPNMRRLVDWAIDCGETDRALPILAPFVRASYGSGLRLVRLASILLASSQSETHPDLPGVMAIAAIDLATRDDTSAAIALCRDSRRISEQLGAAPLAQAFQGEGMTLTYQGHMADGLHMARLALAQARESEDPISEVASLTAIAVWGQASGELDVEEALESAEEAWRVALTTENPTALASAKLGLGYPQLDSSPEAALGELLEGLSHAAGIESIISDGLAMGVAVALARLGNPEGAIEYVAPRLREWERKGSNAMIDGFMFSASQAALESGDPQIAARLAGYGSSRGMWEIAPPHSRQRLKQDLATTLGEEESERLLSEGAEFSIDQALDVLHGFLDEYYPDRT